MPSLRRIYVLCLLCLALLASAGIASAQEQTYTVRPGDNLQRIANEFSVSLDALLIRNDIIDPNRIRVGQTLIIPLGPVAIPQTHTVLRGERLSDIALRYGTTVEAILQSNGFSNPNLIQAGQVLTLPGAGGFVESRSIESGNIVPGSTVTTPVTTAPPTTANPVTIAPVTTVGAGGSTTPTTTTGSTTSQVYVIDIGETLQTVAARFGTTWQAIAAANGLSNPNYVQAGQRLIIPATAVGGPVASPPPTTPVVVAPVQSANRLYVVRAGDMLSSIAARYGVTVQSIALLNGITNNRAIFPGQTLLIPAAGSPGSGGGVVYQPNVPRQTFSGRYIVRQGDTMLAIAQSFRVNAFDIARANRIYNLNQIFTGQSLIIPGR